MLIWSSLVSCNLPAPTALAVALEGDADTDVDTDADPMCSFYAPSVEWEDEGAAWGDRARARMRPDWDCSGYSPELQVLCDDLKRGVPVTGADREWYVSGGLRRWSEQTYQQLLSLPPEAFIAGNSSPE